MALVFLDGFDHIPVSGDPRAMLNRKGWITDQSYTPSIVSSPARHGGKSLALFNAPRVSVVLSSSGATIVYGLAIYLSAANSLTRFEIREPTTAYPQVTLLLTPTGTTVYRGHINSNNVLGTGSTPWTTGVWWYLEVKVIISNTTSGAVQVVQNGVTVVNLSNIATRGNSASTPCTTDTWGSLDFYVPPGNSTVYYDDLYILDGSGSVNNDFWGDVRIDAHYPNGAGSKAEWAPSAGSNYQNVDDGASGPDDDTTKNTSSTLGQIDTFALENLKNPGAVIRGVQVLNCASKDNAGSCITRNVLRIGGTEYEGANQYPSFGSWRYGRDVHDVSPATSTTWDETEFNNMEAGYKRQA